MKNVFLMLVMGSLVSSAYAGECANGVCTALVRPVRKVVNITREIVVAPVRTAVAIVTPRNSCTVVSADACECGCSESNKTVTKYQPLRRRLVNRSTSVSCCE